MEAKEAENNRLLDQLYSKEEEMEAALRDKDEEVKQMRWKVTAREVEVTQLKEKVSSPEDSADDKIQAKDDQIAVLAEKAEAMKKELAASQERFLLAEAGKKELEVKVEEMEKQKEQEFWDAEDKRLGSDDQERLQTFDDDFNSLKEEINSIKAEFADAFDAYI